MQLHNQLLNQSATCACEKKISFTCQLIKLNVDIIIIILKQLTIKISNHEIKNARKKEES